MNMKTKKHLFTSLMAGIFNRRFPQGWLGGFAAGLSCLVSVVPTATSYASDAPVITQQPQNQVAGVGQTVTFNVVAEGTPPLMYQWRLNGMGLIGESTSSLRLLNVQTNRLETTPCWS